MRCFDRGLGALVIGTFKFVETRPMGREIGRFEEVYVLGLTQRIEDQAREAQTDSPAGGNECADDFAPLPGALQGGELVMVDLAGGEGSVDG